MLPEQIFGLEKNKKNCQNFFVHKNFGPKIFFATKHFVEGKQFSVQRKFQFRKKILVKKMLLKKKFLVQQNFGTTIIALDDRCPRVSDINKCY